jgi:hypothetical protein
MRARAQYGATAVGTCEAPGMIGSQQGERRREPRYNLGGRVTWRRLDDANIGRGWIVDRSDSGVAFITAVRGGPSCGDEITVFAVDQPRTASPPEPVCVCRVSRYDANLNLIACRAPGGGETWMRRG